jgi:WD40 repeat protein
MNMKQPIKFAIGSLLILLTAELTTAQKPELVVQTGHSSDVISLAFSPNGKSLVSASGNQTIKVWDVQTGTELRTLSGHKAAVLAVSFSSDGKTLASGSDDMTVKLWDVPKGKEIRTLVGHAQSVKSVSFSPDGKTLATGSEDKTIKLWDVATGKELTTLSGHTASVTSVSFSPDGKTVASGSWDDTIKLWDVQTRTALKTLSQHSHLFSVSFSSSGKILAGGSYGQITLWDVETAKELRSFPLRPASDPWSCLVAFSPDGRILAGGSYDTLRLWDVETGRELMTLSEHSEWTHVGSISFSPDSKTLVIGVGHAIKLFELATANALRVLSEHAAAINSVSFSSDGQTLSSGGDKTLNLWFGAASTPLKALSAQPLHCDSVTFSPDGKSLAGGCDKNTIRLWDVSTGKELKTLSGHVDSVNSIAFSPDGKILASGSEDRSIKLWDVASGLQLRSLVGHEDSVLSVAFSPDGKLLASGGSYDDNKIKLWNVSTGQDLLTLTDSAYVASIAFSPDGKILASGSSDTIKLWDVKTAKELRTFSRPSGIGFSVSFSSDGKMLAAAVDHEIKLWDVESGEELGTLTGHTSTVNSLSFSPNDRLLLSGGYDATLKLWDVKTRKELASLIALDEHDWVVVTPDGLFDGSPAAWNQLIWRFNNNTFDHATVEAYFNEFYYPGLLADIFAGKRPTAPSDISQKDRRQPQLKLTLAGTQSDTKSAAVKIDVAELAQDKENKTGSGAQDVRLFRNGSLVKVWRGDVLKGQSSARLEATIPIVAGENKLTAYAFNHDNIKSSDAALTVTGADSLKRKGTLRILAVGVSQYANPEYNLNYTTDDATSFATQLKLEQEKQSRYQSVEIKMLLNQNATKANILAELKKLAAVVQPEDAMVVYFSGHGKASGDHFYLVPHDLGYTGSRDQLSDEGLQQILKHSISDVELEEAFRDIDAGQMFMIIDACNSGQALENKDEPRRGPMNTRGLAQLAYEKGMYIMTASQNVEEAFVSEKLKHSYLTFALVEEGLKTKAADADHDGKVELREWFDYALARVPKLREEVLQTKSLEEVTPKMKAARNQKSQTPRVFYRREADSNPLIVALVGATAPQ